MKASAFSQSAYAALQDMRRRTSALLVDANASPVIERPGLARRLSRGWSTATGLAKRWRWARNNAVLRNGADWLVLFSPSRTPKLPHETDYSFFSRVARTNRELSLPPLLGVAPEANLQCLEVHPGLDTGAYAASVLDYILAQFSLADILRTFFGAAMSSGREKAVAGGVIDRLSIALNKRATRVIMLTSNSLLPELLRLAACRAEEGGSTEVLHGIASVAMEPYYDFVETNARGSLRYVNLIDGLVHFRSIERHLLRDNAGEVAVNCHIWSRIGVDNTLTLPAALTAQQPLVIVGGTSSSSNYFQTQFFENECHLMSLARRHLPARTIVYCPHPANKPTAELIRRLDDQAVSLSALPTLSMLFCAGAVVGTYSTSLFEAALLGKRVFLLPFDHAMLMPELIENVDFSISPETLADDFALFAATLGDGLKPDAVAHTKSLVARRLGLLLRID